VKVTIQAQNANGRWTNVTSATPPVGQTWQYHIRQASGRNYRMKLEATASSVSCVIAEFPPVN